MTPRFCLSCVIALLLGQSATLPAQGDKGPFTTHLFSPELLMRYHAELDLSGEQRERIRTRMETAGRRIRKHEMQRSEATQQLSRLLAEGRVDEEAALRRLDDALAAEREIKKLRLRVMIQVRNELTAEQRRLASELRNGNATASRPAGTRINNDRKLRTPDEVRAEIDALKQEEIAWRKIDWRTCLVEGLAASRKQNKPVILWIFIDRPIDDERC